MFIGKITYKEHNGVQKLELKHESVFELLDIVARFDDLSIIEIHIYVDNSK